MGGKRSRDKGNRREREMVARLEKMPRVSANRVPLSGACEGYKGDIRMFSFPLGRALQVEVKARATATGWKSIKEWLGANNLLFLCEDREEPLVVMPWGEFASIMERLAVLDEAADP